MSGLQIAISERWLVQQEWDVCDFVHDWYLQTADSEAGP